MHIILKDGTRLDHVGATGMIKYIQGANRDTITFEFSEEYNIEYLRSVFTQSNCEVINIVTDEQHTLENGETETVYTNNYHEGYVIRAGVYEEIKELVPATGTSPAITETRVFVTMAQRTYQETQIASLTEVVDILLLENLLTI